MTHRPKNIIFDSETLNDFENALREGLEKTVNQWSGWYIPIFANLEKWDGDNPCYFLKFTVGSLVSRGTSFIGGNPCVYHVESWKSEEEDLDSEIDSIVSEWSGTDELACLYEDIRTAFPDYNLSVK